MVGALLVKQKKELINVRSAKKRDIRYSNTKRKEHISFRLIYMFLFM